MRPLFGHELVFLVMDYERPELWALRPGARGDVTETNVAWKLTKGAPKQPSFLSVGDLLYLVSDTGIAMCLEAKTGAVVWRQRLEGDYSSSMLYADGRIHCFNRDAAATLIEPGRTCKVLAVNRLEGQMMASPAVIGRALLLRTEKHLYRIEKTAAGSER